MGGYPWASVGAPGAKCPPGLSRLDGGIQYPKAASLESLWEGVFLKC